jgi:hypothetical protein
LRPSTGAFDTVKAVKDVRQIGFADANAGISYRELHAVTGSFQQN